MKPTNKLRWKWVLNDEAKEIPVSSLRSYDSVFIYTLQQYWEDDAGNGEWRNIPVED